MRIMGKKGSRLDPYTDWILENAKTYPNATELLEAFNLYSGLNITKPTLKKWMKTRFGTYKICGIYREYTDEQKEFLRLYYPTHGTIDTTEQFNLVFDDDRTQDSISNMCSRLGIKLTDETKSKLNNLAGLKHPSYDIGATRKEVYPDGQVVYRVKTKEGWKTAGRAVWEAAYGPIPKGYKLIYLDGNNQNYKLENLYLVDAKTQYQVIRNKHYKSGEPEITKTLIKYYELRNALGINCYDFQAYERKLARKYKMEGLICESEI